MYWSRNCCNKYECSNKCSFFPNPRGGQNLVHNSHRFTIENRWSASRCAILLQSTGQSVPVQIPKRPTISSHLIWYAATTSLHSNLWWQKLSPAPRREDAHNELLPIRQRRYLCHLPWSLQTSVYNPCLRQRQDVTTSLWSSSWQAPDNVTYILPDCKTESGPEQHSSGTSNPFLTWQAAQNAVQNGFQCQLKGCMFHFRQTNWRNIQRSGLQTLFNNNPRVNLLISVT